MDLHSGAAFWLASNGLVTAPPRLTGPEHCDVVIIGAGVTGALLADALSADGLDIIVLDRREPGLGSTAASTALLLFEIDVELADLAQRIGNEAAVRCYRLGLDAIATLERLSGELGGCGFARRPSIYLASRRRHRVRLAKEAALRQRYNLPCEFWTKAEVAARYSFPCHGAIWSDSAAQIDPLELTRRLLDRARGRGTRVYARTAMRSYQVQENGVLVEAESGGPVRARCIVFAIGYEVPQNLRKELVSLRSTYCLATHVVDHWRGWEDQCLVWESARPYSYLRTSKDNRILMGGADVRFKDAATRDRLMPGRITKLEQRLKKMLPDIRTETAFSWGGTFGETRDGLPYIGPIESHPGAFFALGYGGNGITFGAIAADILRQLCRDREHPDAWLFRLER
ncbi:MAG TPA: FAD-dependent oxidoreductase [Gemmatimonadales bacterium]|nr:FAD-dependent oxidoreductase [Gemmatimonadales bacterium]